MKKHLGITLFAALLGATVLTALPVCAQTVKTDGDPFVLPVYSSVEKGAEPQEKELRSFTVFGREDDTFMLIQTEDSTDEAEYAKREDILAILPEFEADRFPAVADVKTAGLSASGEDVLRVQEAMISMHYMEGEADGYFGEGTAEAVSKFQEEHGLETTGFAGTYTMLLIAGISEGLEDTVVIAEKTYDTPKEKFPQIAGRTRADLVPFLEGSWHFIFDEFEDAGEIDPSLILGSFEVEGADIDRIHGDLSVKVLVKKDDAGNSYTLVPALVMESNGAYRPYLQGVILAGKSNIRLDGAENSGRVEGISLKETGTVALTEEALEQLKKGRIKSIRVIGKNTTYDVDVTIEKEELTAFLEACEELTAKE